MKNIKLFKKFSALFLMLILTATIVFSFGCDTQKDEYDSSVILISIDGMRPDAIDKTEYGNYLKTISSYSLSVKTVNPSITLPCHTSMLYGVEPSVHGITTNTYTPSENIGKSIFDCLNDKSLKSVAFYNWKELGDIINETSVETKTYIGGEIYGWEQANNSLANEFISYIKNNDFDFAFLYLGFLDEWGHRYGWLSNEYFYALEESLKIVKEVIETAPQSASIILTSDHGGHDKGHGSTLPEDMTIPLYAIGDFFEKGNKLDNLSMLNVAPTVLKLLNVTQPKSWQGKSIL